MKNVDYKSVELEHFPDPQSRGAGIRWLIGQADGAPNFAMRMIEIEPCGYSPCHSHQGEHEVFVWSGRGELKIEGRTLPLVPGTAVFIPEKVEHQFVNSSDTGKLEFICVIPLKKQ